MSYPIPHALISWLRRYSGRLMFVAALMFAALSYIGLQGDVSEAKGETGKFGRKGEKSGFNKDAAKNEGQIPTVA